jgi:nucleoside-diphosphate-sugar epimerase
MSSVRPPVAVTGFRSVLGQRVRAMIEGRETVEVRPVDDLLTGDLKPFIEDTEAVLHLATGIPSSPSGATTDVEATRRVLDAAGAASVRHIVVLSDATVYGAWPNNPVPLTDDAVLRPNPGFRFAAERAEIERLAGDWRAAHPGSTLAILRPVRTPGRADWLVRALRPAGAVPEHVEEPPVQFLHLDDLAAAVDIAWSKHLDGAYNVAPDGSIPGDEARLLIGARPRVRLPDRLLQRLVRWRFRSGLTATPPELVPYTVHPWVVANDRLRAAGWRPTMTNEEVCVEAHEAGPLADLSPQRRQDIALGVAGAGLAAVVGGAVVVLRRLLRRG